MQVKASIAVVFLAISGSAIAYTVPLLKDALAPKAPIANGSIPILQEGKRTGSLFASILRE